MRIHRRGAIPILLLLVLVVFGAVMQIVRGAADPRAAVPAANPATHAIPAETRRARDALRGLAAVQRAFNAGNVKLLCRPGALVDPAVVREQDGRTGGCESELERLMANEPPMRLTVLRLALRRDLATAAVTTRSGSRASVDLVRRGERWQLSFSQGNDPMPALAGVA
jgi:hypothetical protein